MTGNTAAGLACEPPSGSGTISSMTPNLSSSGDVMRSASVASLVAARLFHRMAAHASGDAT
eukprot:213452-Chlamydomonas_euryale.AAC.16